MGDRQKLVDFLMDNLPKEHPWAGRVVELVDKLEAEGFTFSTRCKNCKHWRDGVPGCTDHVKVCDIGFYMVGENGYCVYGEKMDGGNEDA